MTDSLTGGDMHPRTVAALHLDAARREGSRPAAAELVGALRSLIRDDLDAARLAFALVASAGDRGQGPLRARALDLLDALHRGDAGAIQSSVHAVAALVDGEGSAEMLLAAALWLWSGDRNA
jgi:hypothetical protein